MSEKINPETGKPIYVMDCGSTHLARMFPIRQRCPKGHSILLGEPDDSAFCPACVWAGETVWEDQKHGQD